ncbi:DUF6191 domain-containing protein [Streptomyces sp. 2RAF24]|uniref:DUF6191 domain-containing protein n=1 Tax=unclassified Streptomyces TaxID=2593676 RepID=UPI0033D909DC
MFNLMEDLFAPGRKHTDDERQRLALTREDMGDADPHKGPIDLTSGKVVIRLPGAAEKPSPAADDRETGDRETGDREAGDPGAAS